MRKCKYIKRIRRYDENNKQITDEIISDGVWLGWGIDFAEFETSGACYTAGIIELPDGKIKLIRADDIQFTDGARKDEDGKSLQRTTEQSTPAVEAGMQS